MNTDIFTEDNKDDFAAAVESLNTFTHNWCMDCEETKKQKDLVFRCNKCVFSTGEHTRYCLIKIFANEHGANINDFGCMTH